MIIEEYKIGKTTIRVHDDYLPKTQEEHDERVKRFKQVGYEIYVNYLEREREKRAKRLENKMKKTKEQDNNN